MMIKTEDTAGTSSDARGVITTVVETEVEAVIASPGARRDRGEMHQTLEVVEEVAETSLTVGSVSLVEVAREVMATVAVTGALLLRE